MSITQLFNKSFVFSDHVGAFKNNDALGSNSYNELILHHFLRN